MGPQGHSQTKLATDFDKIAMGKCKGTKKAMKGPG